MVYRSLNQVQNDLRSGTITCAQLVEDYLTRIESATDLNAFLEVFADTARAKAAEVDRKWQDGTAGRLAGMVIGLKDNICYKDHPISASSRILENFDSLFSATVVERLLAEDAIIIGRLNCDEFAMGSSNENSAFGPVKHPEDHTRVPGGSSGGAAAVVNAGLCLASLGSDTGGSIRQPASFCGIVGLKPSYGRVSRHGLIAYASSFDQIGPLTNNVADAALLLEIMGGADDYDSTASQRAVPAYSEQTGLGRKARIGYLQTALDKEGLDPEVKSRAMWMIDRLREQGHTVEPVETAYLDHMVPTYYVITTAEASSNLSRFDGIRYGYRSPNAVDLNTTYTKSRSEGFGEEVQRRIMLGTFVLSAGYYDAYFSKGQKVRRLIRDEAQGLLENFDFLFSPTTPHTAFEIGSKSDPITMYLEDIFTVQANICGFPAISLPAGRHSNGLPIGMQFMGANFGEADLLAFSQEISDSIQNEA